MRILPIDRMIRRHIFEDVADTGLIGGVDETAEDAAQHRADERAADDRSRAAALIRADDAAKHRADGRADGIAVAGGMAIAIAVAVIAVDRVIAGIGTGIIVVAVAVSVDVMHINRLRDRHIVVHIPVDDDRTVRMRLAAAMPAIPGAIRIDRLVGPLVLRLVVEVTPVILLAPG